MDEPIPNVDATPTYVLPEPPQLDEGTGTITYRHITAREACDDCRQLMYEQSKRGERQNPSVAHIAKYKRTRSGKERLLCVEHTQMRKATEPRTPRKTTR